jgi:hypothetical protein
MGDKETSSTLYHVGRRQSIRFLPKNKKYVLGEVIMHEAAFLAAIVTGSLDPFP